MLTPDLTAPGGPAELVLIMLIALLADMALGDPQWLYRALPHPVAAFGNLVAAAETRLNRPARGARDLFWRGLTVTAALVLLAAGAGLLLQEICQALPFGWLLEGLAASGLIAYRGLQQGVAAVARGLTDSLAAGRAAVRHIVGRDPESLNEAGVARAAAESLAENFSDGVVAPLFWFALLGLPGLAAYKAINTLDSMIGYKTGRFAAFGKAAARLDDAVNWLPARLTGGLLVAAAALSPGADAKRAWRVMCRDAPKHRSPNAGWQEAAMAGALNIALAGPRRYGLEVVEDAWMGDGKRNLGPNDLRRALLLYRLAGVLLVAILAAGWLLLR
jgi:adenosylcobinamide-phosphate synthase